MCSSDLGAKVAIVIGCGAVLAALLVFFGPGILRWLRSRDYAGRIHRGETRPSDATLLYQRMLVLLAKRGIQKPPWLTPAEFSRILVPPANAPEIAPLVSDATEAYNELRFGGRADAAPRMMRLLEAIEKL